MTALALVSCSGAGDAGLHRRLVSPGDAVEQHEADHHQRHQGHSVQEESKQQDQTRRGKVQHHHDVPLADTVRHRAACRGAEHRGDKRRRPHRPEESGGAGLAQQIQRQGEAQDGAAEERDDLPDDHQGEIPAEQGGLRMFHRNISFL